MKLNFLSGRTLRGFMESEKSGGLTLIVCTLVSLLLANSSIGEQYLGMWNFHVAGHGIAHWINDGLMAIFFLLVGLELIQEIYEGELSNVKRALLPLSGALGGMIVPAGIYMMFKDGFSHTWAIVRSHFGFYGQFGETLKRRQKHQIKDYYQTKWLIFKHFLK